MQNLLRLFFLFLLTQLLLLGQRSAQHITNCYTGPFCGISNEQVMMFQTNIIGIANGKIPRYIRGTKDISYFFESIIDPRGQFSQRLFSRKIPKTNRNIYFGYFDRINGQGLSFGQIFRDGKYIFDVFPIKRRGNIGITASFKANF